MRLLVLASILAVGLASGCSALTPAAIQDATARLNRDLPLIRAAVAQVSTNAKLLADLDIITSNVATMDAILNK